MVRFDPVQGYNFIVALVSSSSALAGQQTSIQNIGVGGFSECSGLETSLEVEEYKEGGLNGTVLKFPTRVTWGNIHLRRGIAISNDLWLWHHGFVEGRGQRYDGTITLQNDQHQPVRVWHFTRGLPVKWVGPTMNASQSQVAVEELEIAHEGLTMLPVSATLSDVVNAASGVVNALGSIF